MSLKDTLDKFGSYVVQQSRSNLSKEGKKDTNSLYDSLGYETKVSNNSIELTITMADYGKFIDKGVRGAGGVRKTTSKFNKRNNKGKLWKIKGKNSEYKFGKSGGISPKHFEGWAKRKGLSKFAVAKAVYHQGLETTNFFTTPFERAFKRFPDEVIEAYGLEVDSLMKTAIQ
jgi:hypothetical protein